MLVMLNLITKGTGQFEKIILKLYFMVRGLLFQKIFRFVFQTERRLLKPFDEKGLKADHSILAFLVIL